MKKKIFLSGVAILMLAFVHIADAAAEESRADWISRSGHPDRLPASH